MTIATKDDRIGQGEPSHGMNGRRHAKRGEWRAVEEAEEAEDPKAAMGPKVR
jgi:hypothetical protein